MFISYLKYNWSLEKNSSLSKICLTVKRYVRGTLYFSQMKDGEIYFTWHVTKLWQSISLSLKEAKIYPLHKLVCLLVHQTPRGLWYKQRVTLASRINSQNATSIRSNSWLTFFKEADPIHHLYDTPRLQNCSTIPDKPVDFKISFKNLTSERCHTGMKPYISCGELVWVHWFSEKLTAKVITTIFMSAHFWSWHRMQNAIVLIHKSGMVPFWCQQAGEGSLWIDTIAHPSIADSATSAGVGRDKNKVKRKEYPFVDLHKLQGLYGVIEVVVFCLLELLLGQSIDPRKKNKNKKHNNHDNERGKMKSSVFWCGLCVGVEVLVSWCGSSGRHSQEFEIFEKRTLWM